MTMKLHIYVTAILLAWSCHVRGSNVAVGKQATQTTNMFQYATADKAVDGNNDKNFYSQTCTHTACNDNTPPSWTVDLGQNYDITSITIANPIQAYGRLKNIKIEIFYADPATPGEVGMLCTTIGATAKPDGIDVVLPCTTTLTGHYLKISKTLIGPDINGYCDALLLCEVSVEGTEPVPFTCDLGFTEFEGSCFHVSSQITSNNVKVSWYNAREACRAMGADLAILDNADENEFVWTLLGSSNDFHWVGSYAFADGATWQWLDPDANPITTLGGSPGYENWAQGEPSGTSYCMVVRHSEDGTSQWTNLRCKLLRHYICEKSPSWPN